MILDFPTVYKKYNLDIKGVIHIGAHFGEELDIYENFGINNIFLFEPIESNFEQLSKNVSNRQSNIKIYNVALGNENCEVEMNISSNDKTSSSILEPKVHLIAHPEVSFIGKEKVKMMRMDDFDINDSNMMVIDVQGYELEVLKGSKNTLEQIDYIYIEVNRDEVYENNARIEEVDQYLFEYGFRRLETSWYYTQVWGDALYIKNKNYQLTMNQENLEKIDIVVQGPYTDFTSYVCESYLELPFVNNVIVSCWEDDKVSYKNRRVKVVKNKYPESPGTDNKNLQIVSSLNGLKESKTKFSIKVRSDQRFTYDSMMKMYDFFLQNNERNLSYQYEKNKPHNRIFVAGVYPNLLFAIRDHIFWGHTDDLIELFNIPLEKNSLVDIVKVPKERLGNYLDYFTRTETYIGAHYCANFNEEVNRLLILQKEHLYDNSVYWYYSKELSDSITYSVFKSFPKTSIDLEWVNWRKHGFDFRFNEYLERSSWHEEGF